MAVLTNPMFLKKFAIRRRELGSPQQVGAALKRPQERLLAAPLLDLCVIAREQDLWNGFAAKLGRARVVRILEQARGVRIIAGAVWIAQNTWQKARDRVDDNERGQFAAREYVIADGDLIGHDLLTDTLVHALIATTNQSHAIVPCQLGGNGLAEDAP